MNALPHPCLMLVTEPRLHLPEIIVEAVGGGVDVVQLRDKAASHHELLAMTRGLRAFLSRPTLLIVNRAVEAASQAPADGVHLPEWRSVAEVKENLTGRDILVGRSVHSLETARQAARDGADYLVAGTIYDSRSHPEAAPAGPDFLRDLCGSVSIPVLAIGGVTPENAGECIAAGAMGVAVLSPIMQAADPRAIAVRYRKALDVAWEER